MLTALLVLFLAIQVADGVSTALVLSRGGYERNPIVAWGMDKIGVIPALLVYKIAGMACGVTLYHLADAGGGYALAVLTAAGSWVVVNNTKAYIKLLRR